MFDQVPNVGLLSGEYEEQFSTTSRRWRYRLGKFEIVVDELSTSRGPVNVSTTQSAEVRQHGAEIPLWHCKVVLTDMLRLREPGEPLPGQLDVRGQALAWLIKHRRSAAASYRKLRAGEDERPRLKNTELARCIELGPFEYLALNRRVHLPTDTLARLLRKPTRELNRWLTEQGLVEHRAGRWYATDPGLAVEFMSSQVHWNARGLQAVWAAAREAGMTNRPDEYLLMQIRRSLGFLPVWSILDAAGSMPD